MPKPTRLICKKEKAKWAPKGAPKHLKWAYKVTGSRLELTGLTPTKQAANEAASTVALRITQLETYGEARQHPSKFVINAKQKEIRNNA